MISLFLSFISCFVDNVGGDVSSMDEEEEDNDEFGVVYSSFSCFVLLVFEVLLLILYNTFLIR